MQVYGERANVSSAGFAVQNAVNFPPNHLPAPAPDPEKTMLERQGNARAALVALLLPVSAAAAEIPSDTVDFPARPMRLIVPFPSGSGPDANARVFAAGLTAVFGQQILIDNRPGASGIVGTQLAAKSPADGYTLLLATASTFAFVPNLYEKLPFDPDRDFLPVSQIELIPCALVVNPSVPAKTIGELIALAKTKPGQLTFGSSGNGSFQHVSAELFNSLSGTALRHIPYGAGGPYADLISGQLPLMFDTLSPFLPNVKAGKLRALAVSARQRRPQVPEVPTFIEAGLPTFESGAWYGLAAPAGTPRLIITRLRAAIVETLKSNEVAEKLTNLSAGSIVGNTPEEFTTFIRTERAKWGRVIQRAGLKLEL
jgi:tripartite-type tricarboxylate transporter receptor subunit TctC